MPHQCVACGTFYPDSSPELVQGCTTCGSKLFFYMRNRKPRPSPASVLSKEQQDAIRDDVANVLGRELARDEPVVLDLESVRVARPGTYEIDLVNLFNAQRPVIIKLDEGKYELDLGKVSLSPTQK